MTVHRRHPTDDDPADAILFDDCERCEQHARMLVGLDDDHLARLYGRMSDVEYGADDGYRTINEATAGRNLYAAIRLTDRLRVAIGAMP
jgi:hypothetical protein